MTNGVDMPIKIDFAGVLPGSVDYRDFVNKIDPVIVQIGSHDGVLGEEYGLQELIEELDSFKLILVEPLEQYFNNLRSVYEKYESKIVYCNHAISEIDGYTYMIPSGGSSHINHAGGVQIKSKTWETFIKENKIQHIDLLLLDCEGYEYEILKTIDFTSIKPKIIRYEYAHIPDKIGCDEFLKSKGYRIKFCRHDHTFNKIAIT